jgi:hypothetical protein
LLRWWVVEGPCTLASASTTGGSCDFAELHQCGWDQAESPLTRPRVSAGRRDPWAFAQSSRPCGGVAERRDLSRNRAATHLAKLSKCCKERMPQTSDPSALGPCIAFVMRKGVPRFVRLCVPPPPQQPCCRALCPSTACRYMPTSQACRRLSSVSDRCANSLGRCSLSCAKLWLLTVLCCGS